jgi:hypothetical protein
MVKVTIHTADGTSLDKTLEKVVKDAERLGRSKPAGFVVGYIQMRIEAIIKESGVTVRQTHEHCEGPILRFFPYHP